MGGVVLVDMLDSRTRRAALRVDADELRISGPNGTAVTRAPAGATVEDGTAVWRPDQRGARLSGGGVVVAGAGALSLALSLGLDTAVAETLVAFSTLYALVAAGALTMDRPAPRVALGWTLAAAVLVGAVASVRSVVAFQTVLLSVPALLWFPLGRARGLDRAV